MRKKNFFLGDGQGAEGGAVVTKGGVVIVSASSAASLLKENGVLEAAKRMKFVDVRARTRGLTSPVEPKGGPRAKYKFR